MDLNDAITAHLRWKLHLLQCIGGQAEPPASAEAAREDACPLGRWLVEGGSPQAASAAFRETKRTHAEFHLRAAEVVAALERGAKSDAAVMLEAGTPYAAASDAVVFALSKLRAEIRKAARTAPKR